MQAGNISDPGNGMYHEQLGPSLTDVKPKATKRSCKNKLGGPRVLTCGQLDRTKE